MTTVPGFSSRSTDTTIRQLPQRDEVAVTDIAGMEKPGWSNSQSVDTSADAPTETDAKAITETDSKVVEPAAAEDKSVAKKSTAKKTAARKSSARKKG